MVLLISWICFIYAFFALWGMLNELKSFRQKDDLNPILFFLPIISILELWKLPAKIVDAKAMAGVPNPQAPHPVLYLLLGIYFLPVDLNEIFQTAAARQGGAPMTGEPR